MQLRVCDTKILYDTEFEAEIAARKTEHRYGTQMHHYSCFGAGGNYRPHWHVAHSRRSSRRGAGKGYIKCPVCYLLMKNTPVKIRNHRCTEKAPEGA